VDVLPHLDSVCCYAIVIQPGLPPATRTGWLWLRYFSLVMLSQIQTLPVLLAESIHAVFVSRQFDPTRRQFYVSSAISGYIQSV